MPPSRPDHPPRPRLTVRVGVAGHLWDKIKRKDAEAIQERFHQVFEAIEDEVRSIRIDPEAGYLGPETTDSPPPSADADPETEVTLDEERRRRAPAVLRVLSGLAEGSDRLGARVARSRPSRWKLTAMLPYDRETYLSSFTLKKQLPDGTEVSCVEGDPGYGEPDTVSQREFIDLCEAAEQEGGIQELYGIPGVKGAYEPLAKALCRNSDLVVVLWDHSFGGAGGTGDVVRQAAELGIPVVRIPTDGVGNPWVHRAGKEEEARAMGLRPLAGYFQRLLVAPKPTKEDMEVERDNPRERYFAERPRTGRAGRIYDLFFNTLAGRSPPMPRPIPPPYGDATPLGPKRPPHADRAEPDLVRELKEKWEREWIAQGTSHDLCRALTATGIHRHYAWASHLATHNGGRYRSLFLMNYMLSWLAVAAAAAGIAFARASFDTGVKAAAIVEVLLLICILGIFFYGTRHRFHSRWLDCRRLAEWIRSLPILLPLSRTPVLGVDPSILRRAPVHGADPSTFSRAPGPGVDSSGESWVDWMFRAVVREAGVLPISLNEQLVGTQGILAEGVLAGQIDYHGRTSHRNGNVDTFLHRVTLVAFVLALLLSVYHALGAFDFHPLRVPEEIDLTFLALTLIIPAFGGAMHGLRNQGDYEATTIRSRRIRDRLMELEEELKKLETPTVSGVADIAVKTAGVMNAELSAWLVAYQNKDIQAV